SRSEGSRVESVDPANFRCAPAEFRVVTAARFRSRNLLREMHHLVRHHGNERYALPDQRGRYIDAVAVALHVALTLPTLGTRDMKFYFVRLGKPPTAKRVRRAQVSVSRRQHASFERESMHVLALKKRIIECEKLREFSSKLVQKSLALV